MKYIINITSDWNMNKLFEAFYRNTSNEKDMFLVEGLDVNEYRKTVTLTDKHNRGVDFSKEKPLVYHYKFMNYNLTVISIFKRMYMNGEFINLDGNPFIYALKNKYGWKFDMTDSEIYKYIRKFLSVCKNIEGHYDVIVMVPSMHQINKRFMNIVAKQVGADLMIEDIFIKTKKSDIWDNIDIESIEDYCYRNYHPNVAMNQVERIMKNIKESLSKMPGEYFSAGLIDKKYIEFIDNIVSINHQYKVQDVMDMLKDKKVLVLDDILSTGSTLSGCVKEIVKYKPKKLDVITLLSKHFYE